MVYHSLRSKKTFKSAKEIEFLPQIQIFLYMVPDVVDLGHFKLVILLAISKFKIS